MFSYPSAPALKRLKSQPNLCAIWSNLMYYEFFLRFLHKPHTTEVIFILVGPRMPFRFHQFRYRLLIVNSISLLIRSLNRKKISFKILKASCHLLLPSKLPKHLRQDSPEKTTTATLLHYKLGAATRRIEGNESLKWPRLLCAAEQAGYCFQGYKFWVCCWFSPLLREVFSSGIPVFPSP